MMDPQAKTKTSPGQSQPQSRQAPKPAGNPGQARKSRAAPGGPAQAPGGPAEQARSKPDLELVSDTLTRGRNGEAHITVEWYWQWINGSHPCGWKIATLEGHQLDVRVETGHYRKEIAGSTHIDTGVLPVSAMVIGLSGQVEITDLETGEKRLVQFRIFEIPGPLGILWKKIKRLLVGPGKG